MGESGTEQAPTRLGFMSYVSQCSLIFYGPIILIWFIDNLFALTYHSKVIMSTGCRKMAPSIERSVLCKHGFHRAIRPVQRAPSFPLYWRLWYCRKEAPAIAQPKQERLCCLRSITSGNDGTTGITVDNTAKQKKKLLMKEAKTVKKWWKLR